MSLLSAPVRAIGYSLALLVLCAVWGWITPARADLYDSTNTIFNVTGQFASGSTLSGTLTLNSGSVFGGNTAGFSVADLTVSGPDNLHFTNVISQGFTYDGLIGPSARYYVVDVGSSANPQAVFYLPTALVNFQEFANYSGGPIAPAVGNGYYSAAYSAAGGFGTDRLTSGSIGAAAPVPSCATALSGTGATYRLVPGGLPSGKSNVFSAMTGVFVPGGGLTLSQAATACGYSSFDWQQSIIGASPGEIPNIKEADGKPLPAPTSTSPVSDPPPSGWYYDGCSGNPYYYSISQSTSSINPPPENADCSRYDLSKHEYTSEELPSLTQNNLCQPMSQGPPALGLPSATILTFCDTPKNMTPGDSINFETTLVGIEKGTETAVSLMPPVFWTSNLSGASIIGATGGVSLGLYENAFNIDVSEAYGGVSLLSTTVIGVSEPSAYPILVASILIAIYLKRRESRVFEVK